MKPKEQTMQQTPTQPSSMPREGKPTRMTKRNIISNSDSVCLSCWTRSTSSVGFGRKGEGTGGGFLWGFLGYGYQTAFRQRRREKRKRKRSKRCHRDWRGVGWRAHIFETSFTIRHLPAASRRCQFGSVFFNIRGKKKKKNIRALFYLFQKHLLLVPAPTTCRHTAGSLSRPNQSTLLRRPHTKHTALTLFRRLNRTNANTNDAIQPHKNCLHLFNGSVPSDLLVILFSWTPLPNKHPTSPTY